MGWPTSRPLTRCTPDWSHFQRISSVIAGVAGIGVPVHVFAHSRFRAEIEGAGARFVDLYTNRAPESADDESWPPHMRFISFAAAHAGEIRREVETLEPGVIVHDPFVVIGAVVAHLLGIPDVTDLARPQLRARVDRPRRLPRSPASRDIRPMPASGGRSCASATGSPTLHRSCT